MEEKYKQIATLQRDYDLLLTAYKDVCGSERTLCLENEQLKQQVKGLEFDRTMCMNGNIKLSMQLTDSYNDIKQLKQQLAEKDELLKNAVVPKFKVGDEVWLIEENGLTDKKELMNCKIQRHSIEYKVDGIFSRTWYYDDSLFATKEEAQKKLEELRWL